MQFVNSLTLSADSLSTYRSSEHLNDNHFKKTLFFIQYFAHSQGATDGGVGGGRWERSPHHAFYTLANNFYTGLRPYIISSVLLQIYLRPPLKFNQLRPCSFQFLDDGTCSQMHLSKFLDAKALHDIFHHKSKSVRSVVNYL